MLKFAFLGVYGYTPYQGGCGFAHLGSSSSGYVCGGWPWFEPWWSFLSSILSSAGWSECAVVVGGSQTMVTGGPSPSCVSVRWVETNMGWGTDHGILKYTTTTAASRRSSFGYHVAHSNIAPGFRIREVNNGGR